MREATKRKPIREQREQSVSQALKDKWALKAQIAARVAPAARKPNVIKKKYLPGSPGDTRRELGVTLTALKARMNETVAIVTVMLDEHGNPTGETTTEARRDTAACTKRRRDYVARSLLGPAKSMRRKFLRSLAVARKARRKFTRYNGADVTPKKAGKK